MLKQAAYLYNNVQTLYTDLAPQGMGYRKMYARNMKLYKGIDNTFQIKLMNGDQKLINAIGQTLSWVLLDRTTAEVKCMLTKTVEGSDNSLVSFTINEGDLEPINSGLYMYSAYLTNESNKKTILYGDSQYGASVPVEIVSNSFPQVYPSIVLDEFVTEQGQNYPNPTTTLYTSAVNARPELNGKNNALHTATFYSTSFNGTVNIEVTLDNGITDVVQWATLDRKIITDSDAISYINFNGVFTFVRFRIAPDSLNTGKVDKILYRS
jgi:hypothetical protein